MKPPYLQYAGTEAAQDAAGDSLPVRGYWLKRPFDILTAGTLLILLSPVFAAVALAIRLTSPGPILFRQRRLGVGERPFTILKFRSMRVDADRVGPGFTSAHDPRITPIGRILRKTSLDELPQLLNVFRGEMSLLGPRPYIGFELEAWSPEERRLRASVRPGISGLSQVRGRSQYTVAQIIASDLEYVDRCSLWLDLKLCVQTVTSVLRSRGTN